MNNDLISREALREAFKSWKTMDDYYHDTDCKDIPLSEAFDLIDNAPTVERPHGEWIYNRPNPQTGANIFRCSICNHETQSFTCGIKNPIFDNYCGNCGADMRVKNELNRVKDELQEGEG